MKITIVGLGLIGGSLAKAIKKYTAHTVYGVNRSESVISEALLCGAIDEKGTAETLKISDIVIVCLYPHETMSFIKDHRKNFKENATIIDACGTKKIICEELMPVAKENNFVFIGTHPMAGKEKGGFANSEAELFGGTSFIITAEDAPENAVNTIKELALSLKFGQVVLTSPAEHDNIIAYTSQLPHVLACAYIKDPVSAKHSGFSAGSFRDVSRVATINASMWSQLFIDNKEALSEHINLLVDNLKLLENAISTSNKAELEELLDAGCKIKESLL